MSVETSLPTQTVNSPLNSWLADINYYPDGSMERFAESGFKYLLTNRLNQDCLNNVFWILRSKGRFGDNPDPQQFRAAFRCAILDRLFVLSTYTNCAFDADKILWDIQM